MFLITYRNHIMGPSMLRCETREEFEATATMIARLVSMKGASDVHYYSLVEITPDATPTAAAPPSSPRSPTSRS